MGNLNKHSKLDFNYESRIKGWRPMILYPTVAGYGIRFDGKSENMTKEGCCPPLPSSPDPDLSVVLQLKLNFVATF